jgi:hypothetical protein
LQTDIVLVETRAQGQLLTHYVHLLHPIFDRQAATVENNASVHFTAIARCAGASPLLTALTQRIEPQVRLAP